MGHETTHARVYRLLRQQLMSGDYLPGSSLSIRFVSEKFDVSATPVREALKRLESQYALTKGPGRTMIVPQLSLGELKDMRDIRLSLEGLLAAKAAERATTEEVDEIANICSQMETAINERHLDEYFRLNADFHRAVYVASKAEVAIGFVDSLWMRAGPYMRLPVAAKSASGFSEGRRLPMECHWACTDALRRRDPENARKSIETDIWTASARTLEHLAEQSRTQLDGVIPQFHSP
ncbi:MAG: GntR family transcriptional regulator [Alphaproteobacteria bacterium]|nr:GntR family transcriptional regulator [Alphaproteobacteria bacterium]